MLVSLFAVTSMVLNVFQAPTVQAATTYTETFNTTTKRDGPTTTADWDTAKSVLELPTVAASFYRIQDSRTTGYDRVIPGVNMAIFNRSLAVDSNGYPHVVWTTDAGGGFEEVLYAKWNGSAWVDAAGNDPETSDCAVTCTFSTDAVVSSGGAGEDAFEATIVLDSTNTPHIAWDSFDTVQFDYDVKYATWSGSAWVKANGTAGQDDLDGNSGDSYAPSIALAGGEPAIAWRDETGGDVDIYYRQWNGSAWVKADNTVGTDDVSNNATTSDDPSLAITSDNRPMIAWRDSDGDNETFFKQWNGSAWVGIDSSAPADYNVSDNATSSTRPSLAVTTSNQPAIAWQDIAAGSNNIFYAQWNGSTWVGPDGTTAYPATITQPSQVIGSDSATRPALRLTSDNRPAITAGFSVSGATSSRYTEWNGSTWTGGTGTDEDGNAATFETSIFHYRSTASGSEIAFDLDGDDNPIVTIGNTIGRWIEPYQFPGGDWYETDLSTVGNDDVSAHTTGTSPQCYSMATDSQGRPHVTWCEIRGTVYTQMYAYWNGSDWVNVKGTTADADYAYSFNPVGRPATAGDLTLDENDLPHVLWAQNIGGSTLGLYYTHWDPAANAGAGGWVNAAGSLYTDATAAPAGTIVDSGFTFAPFPTLDLDSTGKPYVAWSEQTAAPRDDIFVSTWNGSAWVKPTTGAAGSDSISQNIGGTSQTSSIPDLEVSPNDTVGVTWYMDTPAGISIYIWYSQLKSGSPGTWTKADGVDTDANAATFESDQFSPGDRSAAFPELGYTSTNQPSLVWTEASGGVGTTTDVMYTEWNGTSWVNSDGTTSGYENVSQSPDTDFYPRLQIDNNDEPVIAWEEGSFGYFVTRHTTSGSWTPAHKVDPDGDSSTNEVSDAAYYLPLTNASVESRLVLLNGETPDVLLQQGGANPRNTVWHEPYASSVTGTSLAMDSLSDNIAKATLTPSATLNGGTIVYQLSNNGGATWSTVTPGVEFTFPTTGSDLRWRATLTGNPTNNLVSPQIDTLSITIPDIVVPPEEKDPIDRIDAEDPVDLAISISHSRFNNNEADTVLLTRDDLWVDALVGTSLSTIANGPLLLNPTDALNDSVLAEIDRVLPSKDNRIYLLGRERAISENVRAQLTNAGYTDIERLGGINRDETAELIGDEVLSLNATQVDTVYLTENTRLADALTIGAPVANVADGNANPIILSDRSEERLDEFAANFLRKHPEITKLVIIGGHEALPAELETSLHATRADLLLSRLFGDDRYGTCRAIVDTFFTDPTAVVVAGGEAQSIAGARSVQADQLMNGLIGALLASTLAADRGDPLLITRPLELPLIMSTYLSEHASTIDTATIVGTTNDVSAGIAQQIGDLIE